MPNDKQTQLSGAFGAVVVIAVVGIGISICHPVGALAALLIGFHARMSARESTDNSVILSDMAVFMVLFGSFSGLCLLVLPNGAGEIVLAVLLGLVFVRCFIEWVLDSGHKEQGTATHLRGRSQVDAEDAVTTDLVALRRKQREAVKREFESEDAQSNEFMGE